MAFYTTGLFMVQPRAGFGSLLLKLLVIVKATDFWFRFGFAEVSCRSRLMRLR